MSETGPPRPRPLRPFSPEPTAHRPRYSHTPAARSFSYTVFTFGQTGSGKTYTLTGPPPQVGRALAKPPGAGIRGPARSLGERRLPEGKELDGAAQLVYLQARKDQGR